MKNPKTQKVNSRFRQISPHIWLNITRYYYLQKWVDVWEIYSVQWNFVVKSWHLDEALIWNSCKSHNKTYKQSSKFAQNSSQKLKGTTNLFFLIRNLGRIFKPGFAANRERLAIIAVYLRNTLFRIHNIFRTFSNILAKQLRPLWSIHLIPGSIDCVATHLGFNESTTL